MSNSKGFGTAPVFFTAISTILGAILFLRFGFAVGTLGFWGTLLIVFIGHLVTIPTALAVSELATNQKVEGGGEYFIISRSFGLNIGATIGIALYLSQAISVAFYVIAFTEAFQPLFNYVHHHFGLDLPRQAVSLPAMGVLSILILKKGANLGVKALYIVVAVLFLSLILFFLGKTEYAQCEGYTIFSDPVRNMDNFFLVFAIIFPAFTGMTAGVGLSGDLKDPGKSIPLGSIAATVSGMIIYIFIAWKFANSARPDDLINDQLIMKDIALFGVVAVPLGLAASTISSAIGSVMVAPRTLQALALDKTLPLRRINHFLAHGIGPLKEPRNAAIVTCVIAFVFVALGDVDVVAKIISMFFMVTYGSICMISFLYHFGADPSYRPKFRSKWYLSLLGLVVCVMMMFQMNFWYALLSITVMILFYLLISRIHRDRGGLAEIFQGAIFQVTREMQVILQRNEKRREAQKWRPSVVCISKDSFERDRAFDLLSWISYQFGFGTYIHLIEGYYSNATRQKAKDVMEQLLKNTEHKKSKVYIDTLISPSYTSAVAQVIQLPSISGKENNMIIFEYPRDNPENLKEIIDNYTLVQAANFDICILGTSLHPVKYKNGIHVWITMSDYENTNLMILLSYIILAHPDWKKGAIKIFYIAQQQDMEKEKAEFAEMIREGRLQISMKNVEFIKHNEEVSLKQMINERSAEAGLTLLGIREELIKNRGQELFKGFDIEGDLLFVDSQEEKAIQ